jgi:hypothetical protein
MDYNKCDNDEENITYLHVFKVNGLKDLWGLEQERNTPVHLGTTIYEIYEIGTGKEHTCASGNNDMRDLWDWNG